MYRLWAVNGERLTIELSGIIETVDLSLSILLPLSNDNNDILAVADDWGSGIDERIWSWEPPTTGWYLVSVETAGDEGRAEKRGDATQGAREEGGDDIEYSITVSREQGAGPDGFEDDDSFENASFISLIDGEFQEHNFHDADDEDWIVFYAFDTNTYEIKVFEEGINVDAKLELFSSDGSTWLMERDGLDVDSETLFLPNDIISIDESSLFFVKITNVNSISGSGTEYKVKITDTTGGIAAFLNGLFLDNTANIQAEGLLKGEVIIVEHKMEGSQNTISLPANKGVYSILIPVDSSSAWDITGKVLESGFSPSELTSINHSLTEGINRLDFEFDRIHWELVSPTTFSFILNVNDMESAFWYWNSFKQIFTVQNPNEMLSPFLGYWISGSYNLEINSDSVQGENSTDLNPGWNLISSSNVSVILNVNDIVGRIWYWDSTKLVFKIHDVNETLNPLSGYWIYTDKTVTLQFSE